MAYVHTYELFAVYLMIKLIVIFRQEIITFTNVTVHILLSSMIK